MLLFFSILGVLLSIIFLSFNVRKNTSALYLGSFFLLLSLYVFCQYGLLYSKSAFLVTALLATFAFIFSPLYLIGPMLLWYVRSVLSDNHRLRRNDLFHFMPMLIYFVAALPYTFMVPLSEKAVTAMQVVNDVGIMQTYAATFLSEIFPVSAIYLSRPVLVLAYTIWSAALIAKYFFQNTLKGVFQSQNFMLKWIILLLAFVLLLSSSHILLIILTFKMHFSDLAFSLNIIRVLSLLGLIGLLISPFFFPSILYGLPRLPVAVNQMEKESGRMNITEPIKSQNQYENTYLQSIGQRMDIFMQEKQPYLLSQFNINHLAVQLEVPVHHMAYFLREVKKQTFSEYRNKWRIEHAKKLIEEGKSNELTLEAIAGLSGFSNRNSFRSTFQKTEGICPSTFAGQNKKTD
jgi:AraC-like DNA-binding protein